MHDIDKLDAFTRQYLETAIWADLPEEYIGELDIFDIEDNSYQAAVADCAVWQRQHAGLLYELGDDEQAGHYYWLSRCRHGVGFWDCDNGALGEALDKAAENAGTRNVFVENGKIWIEG